MTDTELLRLGLRLLPLPLGPAGFETFLSCWVVTGEPTTLVDCGAPSTAGALIAQLEGLGLTPEYLLLTHIHMDHAGGAGELARRWPRLKVVAHEKALAHLAAPEKLTEDTRAALGSELANAYGPMTPVRPGQLFGPEMLPPGWEALPTPGHAFHHLSFFCDLPEGERACFGGEALGTLGHPSWFIDSAPLPWLRPATPPKQKPSVTAASIGSVKNARWSLYCAAHFAASRDRRLPDRALAQLRLWGAFADQAVREGWDDDETVDQLLAADGELGTWGDLKPDVQGRERFFMRNSIRGLKEFIKGQGNNPTVRPVGSWRRGNDA